MRAFDTTRDCSKTVGCLKAQGYDTIIRYYSRPDLTWKRIGPKEAVAIARGGMQLAAVYQDRQNQAADFSLAKGVASGRRAHDYGANVIFQPAGSAIYFAVDYDATAAEVKDAIIPYFRGVAQAFDDADGGRAYKVGVYGSGRTCRLLKEAGLVDYCWLTQSTGFAEYNKFIASGEWNLKQLMPTTVCGIGGDPDDVNGAKPDFGAFTLDVDALGPAAPPAAAAGGTGGFVVIASGGLRLRSGPGTEFDVQGSLPAGRRVDVIARHDDWAMIDASGDGLADGFVHAAYLRAAG